MNTNSLEDFLLTTGYAPLVGVIAALEGGEDAGTVEGAAHAAGEGGEGGEGAEESAEESEESEEEERDPQESVKAVVRDVAISTLGSITKLFPPGKNSGDVGAEIKKITELILSSDNPPPYELLNSLDAISLAAKCSAAGRPVLLEGFEKVWRGPEEYILSEIDEGLATLIAGDRAEIHRRTASIDAHEAARAKLRTEALRSDERQDLPRRRKQVC